MSDYYEILGVSKDSSFEEIKAAYRKLAVQYHPDKHHGNKEYEEKFKKINEAYDTLKDETKRHQYDNKDSFSFEGFNPFGNGPSGFPFGVDIEEMLFGRKRRPMNPDINVQYQISAKDAYTGVERMVHINNKALKIKIPKGITTGRVLKLKEKGEQPNKSLPPGDINIHIVVIPSEEVLHDDKKYKYYIDNHDLKMMLDISVFDALLGCEKIIPHFNGKKLKVKIPSCVKFDQVLKIKSEGMPILNTDSYGDLYILVKIDMPTELTEKQKQTLYEISS